MSERIKLYNLKTLITERWQVVLLISLFTAGLFIGSFFINNAEGEIAGQIKTIIETNFRQRQEDQSIQIFLDALVKYAIFLFLTFFFGLCGLGYPIVATVPLLCGIANGLQSGFLYQTFGIHGLFYCLLTIYPALTLALISLIFGACESMEMSKTILAILTDKHHLTTENPLKRYAYQYTILTGIILTASLIETLLCRFLLNRFTLFP